MDLGIEDDSGGSQQQSNLNNHRFYSGALSNSDMDIEDFQYLTKLKRSRKTSPIKRLLQDVDICLASFFECIERE